MTSKQNHQGGIRMKNAGRWKLSGVLGVMLTLLLLGGCSSAKKEAGFAYGTFSAAVHRQSETTDIFEMESKVDGLQIESRNLHLNVGASMKLETTVDNPDKAVYRLSYVSSDEKVCTVMRDGTIQGVGSGTAVITAYEIFSGIETEVTVTVDEEIYPQAIVLSREKLTLMEGESVTVRVTVEPEEAENQTVIWSSNDEKTATVSENGRITGVSKGTCVITVVSQADETIRTELQVTVTEREANSDNTENGSTGNAGDHNGTGSSAGTGNENSAEESTADSGTAQSPSGGSYVDAYAEQVLAIVNAKRAEAGLGSLTMNYTLVSAAKVRAVETVQSFSHTRPNGSSCFSAIDEAGAAYSGAGENIAAGQVSADSVMNAWMNSEGHRANILDGNYTQIGIACYYDPNSAYGYYWVQLFIY